MKLNLNLNFQAILAIAQKSQVYVFGLILVGVFAYTAYIVNAALNVKSNESLADPTLSAPVKITFDKNVISKLKQLSTVNGEVPTGSLGSSDPFR